MPSLINSTIWSATQRFLGLAISFVSNIVLARLLCPNDFGAVAMIMVFVGLADVLVDGGLGNALIQKKDLSQDDIRTVFSTNFIVSVILFIVLFSCSSFIESYVKIEGFSLFLRVEAVIVLIRAFYVVNHALMNREMKFKQLAIIALTTNFISTTGAITLALLGCGVWSLIIKNILFDLVSCVLYAVVIKVPYKFGFKRDSFSNLFGFGVFVSLSNMAEAAYSYFLSFILGKKYSVEQLGYYNQAFSLEQIPVYSTTMVLNQVLFPYLSKSQDNKNAIKETIRLSTLVTSFFVYPLMAFLIFFAEPTIVFIYSAKWLPAVPYFQILCVYGFTNFIYHSNRNVLKSIGASKILFYTQMACTMIGILLIVVGMQFSIMVVLSLVVLSSILNLFIIGGFAGKRIEYPIIKQMLDVLPNLVFSFIAASIAYFLLSLIVVPLFVQIVLGGLVCVAVYFLLQVLFHSQSYSVVYSVLIKQIKRNHK